MATTADQGTPAERQAALNEAADLGQERLNTYQLYRETYDGTGATYLTDRAAEYLERHDIRYTENFGETIVDVLADSLKVERFTCDHEPSAEWARELWEQPKTAVLQGVAHCETPKLGDGFVILEPVEGERFPRLRWCKPDVIKPVYPDDDCDEAEYFVKVWNDRFGSEKVRRMNLYFPDRVEKWFTFSSSGQSFWMPWKDEEDNGWPVYLTDTGRDDGEPLGHIVFHLRNKPQGGPFGRSELRAVIPMLNALDKQLLDLFWVMDTQSWGQRWAKAKGDMNLVTAPGEVWKTEDTDAEFGQFTADDPRPLVEVIENQIKRIAARSRTPLHELLYSGTQPSGESRKQAESGKVSKAEDRQTDLGDTWCRIMAQARKLTVLYGDGAGLDSDEPFRCEWKSVATRNEETEARTAEVWHGIGVSAQTLMERNGFDPEIEKERRSEEDADTLDRQQKLFPTTGMSQPPGGTLQPDDDEPPGS